MHACCSGNKSSVPIVILLVIAPHKKLRYVDKKKKPFGTWPIIFYPFLASWYPMTFVSCHLNHNKWKNGNTPVLGRTPSVIGGYYECCKEYICMANWNKPNMALPSSFIWIAACKPVAFKICREYRCGLLNSCSQEQMLRNENIPQIVTVYVIRPILHNEYRGPSQ